MKRWQDIFPEADKKLQKKLKRVKQDFGDKPALIIIDVKRSFIGSIKRPVIESVDEYRTSCGEAGWEALDNIKKLLFACREADIPAVFTTGDAVTRKFCGGSTKTERMRREPDLEAEEIPQEIAPLPTELVIRKTKASIFFGTPLAQSLRTMGVNSLLVAGTSTSGCVRASVVEGFSHGFPCFVVEECTFDRFELSHLVSLFDMDWKYADVISLEEALGYVARVGSRKKIEAGKT